MMNLTPQQIADMKRNLAFARTYGGSIPVQGSAVKS